MNIDKKITFIKKLFLYSAVGLIISVLLSLFVNHYLINSILILSFIGSSSMIALIIVFFILYWIGWFYNKIATAFFRNKKMKNEKNYKKITNLNNKERYK